MNEFEGLVRRIRRVYLRRHPQGIFISYAHKDVECLNSLLEHIEFLKQEGVEIWTDRDIKPGAKFHDEIQGSLLRAQVAVLLVTPAFLKSSYILSNELPHMLQAAETEGLVIFLDSN